MPAVVMAQQLNADQIEPVSALLVAQEQRQYAHNSLLKPPRSPEQVRQQLIQQQQSQQGQSFIALDEQLRLCGYAYTYVWELSASSLLHAFLTPKNGCVSTLVLPPPTHIDAENIRLALLDTLSDYWRTQRTTGDLVRWPHGGQELAPLLQSQGFELDSVCALLPARAFPIHNPTGGLAITLRQARPTEEAILVTLFQEELLAHQPYTPFVRVTPAILTAFTTKLRQRWTGIPLTAGTPLIVVAERAGSIVGMVEATLLDIADDDEPGFTPAGRYISLNNMGVHATERGQGIGRLLLQEILHLFTTQYPELSGCLLWYNPPNPMAQAFWTRSGFQPLWDTFQRLAHAS